MFVSVFVIMLLMGKTALWGIVGVVLLQFHTCPPGEQRLALIFCEKTLCSLIVRARLRIRNTKSYQLKQKAVKGCSLHRLL